MKKILFSITVMLFTFIITTPVFAANNQENDIEKSYEDAVNGVSDIPLSKIKSDVNLSTESFKILSDNKESEEDVEINNYVTSEIIYQDENFTSISATVFSDIYFNTNSNYIQPLADIGDDKYDSTYGVRAYSRVYYTTFTDRNLTWVNLTKVTGGWNVYDSSIKLSSRRVRYGSSGWPGVVQSYTKYPSSNSYTYTLPSSTKPVALTGGYTIGTNSYVQLKRGTSSSWTLYLLNNL